MIDWVTRILTHNPLMALFAVAAVGYLIGKLRVLGFSLGIAAVLFAGLFAGWVAPSVRLPEFVPQLGLVLFVYTLGLASGPGFFAALKLKGLRDNALALGVLVLCFAVTALIAAATGLLPPQRAGLLAGALTNTPALASVIQALHTSGADERVLALPVLVYSLCYPLGVIVPLSAVYTVKRWKRFQNRTTAGASGYPPSAADAVVNLTVRIEVSTGASAETLRRGPGYQVNFGRMRRGIATDVVHDETRFEPGDLVTVIGTERAVNAAARALGSVSSEHIDLDRSKVDFRRMFVSNPAMTCRPLRELQLIQKYDAVITRVRRGDVELVPTADFELELGDRARVVAPRTRMSEVEKLLGDSQRAVAEVDVITFSLGITLGLLLGIVPLPLPGGGSFELGLAGGPLIVGLVLGRVGRTGPLVWTSPFAANLTLRQFGLVLFLAGVGLRAGGQLAASAVSAETTNIVLSGALVTMVSSVVALVLGHRVLKIPLDVMTGTLSGIQTQPAVLAYAVQRSGNDLPNVGYTTVYPVATIAKILLCQLLLLYGG